MRIDEKGYWGISVRWPTVDEEDDGGSRREVLIEDSGKMNFGKVTVNVGKQEVGVGIVQELRC